MADITKLRLRDPKLGSIAEKILAGERLNRSDGLLVATTDDVLG